jgi:hypothetical protein
MTITVLSHTRGQSFNMMNDLMKQSRDNISNLLVTSQNIYFSPRLLLKQTVPKELNNLFIITIV